MTGFDAPSCSTIYLDRPMRNHTLMQTIARANRVFPDKENGLIVDYVGVFRNLEKALAIYGARRLARPASDSPDPGQGRAASTSSTKRSTTAPTCASAVTSTSTSCATRDGFRVHRSCETLPSRRCWSTRSQKREFLTLADRVRKLFKAVLPDPAADSLAATSAVIRVSPRRSASCDRRPADISAVCRCRRRAARPLGRRRGVRDPGRGRGQRPDR